MSLVHVFLKGTKRYQSRKTLRIPQHRRLFNVPLNRKFILLVDSFNVISLQKSDLEPQSHLKKTPSLCVCVYACSGALLNG